ncbi:hypothetical protein ACQP2F_31055 [Actinoplanes sp. CA-030573]|uniref:hypothetical protein n=1 Tax=Actinoplanes sp. CA-030573 TaxID=3239898 RepID=UPI003D8A4083
MSKKMTKALAAVALVGAAGSAAALATAGPAAAAPRGPQPVTTRLAPVTANMPSWVNIAWRTDRPVCDARVSVDGGRSVAVSYLRPGRTTTFRTGDTLRPGRTGVTTIRVNAMRRTSGFEVLKAALSYTDCGRHARTQFARVNLVLPVVRNAGPQGQGQGQGQGHGHGHGHRPGQH